MVRPQGVTTATDDPVRPDFDELYARHRPALVRLAAMTTGSPGAAEDFVQEVFVELLRRADIREPVPWLRRAVVSRCTSHVRRRILERRHAQTYVLDVAPLGPDAVAVRGELARLRPRHRAAVFLRYYLDLPDSEIAEALGCRPATVRSLLHRAHIVLRRSLDDS